MANASDIARSISARYAPALAKVKNMYDRNSVYEIADNNSRREKELRDEAYLEAERANNQRRWEDEALERQLRIEALQDQKEQRKNAAEQAAFELSMAPYQPIRETQEDGSVKVSGQIPAGPMVKMAANALTSPGVPYLDDIVETLVPYTLKAANYQSEHPDEFPLSDGDKNRDYQDYIQNSIEPYDMSYSYGYTPEDIIKQNLKHQNDLELEKQRLAKAMATQNAIYDRNVMNNQYRVQRDQQGYDFKNLYSEKEWESKKDFDDHKTKNRTDSQIAINNAKSQNRKDEIAYSRIAEKVLKGELRIVKNSDTGEIELVNAGGKAEFEKQYGFSPDNEEYKLFRKTYMEKFTEACKYASPEDTVEQIGEKAAKMTETVMNNIKPEVFQKFLQASREDYNNQSAVEEFSKKNDVEQMLNNDLGVNYTPEEKNGLFKEANGGK